MTAAQSSQTGSPGARAAIGSTGVWIRTDAMTARETAELARRVEGLGYGALWFPEILGRNAFVQAGWLLAATQRLHVATGIANIFLREPTPQRQRSVRSPSSRRDASSSGSASRTPPSSSAFSAVTTRTPSRLWSATSTAWSGSHTMPPSRRPPPPPCSPLSALDSCDNHPHHRARKTTFDIRRGRFVRARLSRPEASNR
jgi:Luciferase-like monooxygenase